MVAALLTVLRFSIALWLSVEVGFASKPLTNAPSTYELNVSAHKTTIEYIKSDFSLNTENEQESDPTNGFAIFIDCAIDIPSFLAVFKYIELIVPLHQLRNLRLYSRPPPR